MRAFFDMDGTVAEWRQDKTELDTYCENYFATLNCNDNLVKAMKILHSSYEEVELFIISAYQTDNSFALKDKNSWIDTYLPFIDTYHRIFVPVGKSKAENVPGGIRIDDCLIDDYQINLSDWLSKGGHAIKFLNQVNSLKNWNNDFITMDFSAYGAVLEILKCSA